MARYIEISTYGMTSDGDGGFINAEAVSKEPEFYDVIVTGRYTDDDPKWGYVDIIEEHENLDEAEAGRVFETLINKYPNADICD